MPKIPTINEMLNAGMHFGHQTSKWHPKMEPFIFMSRSGIHIIDLTKTKTLLSNALDFIKNFSAEGKIILFVGTKTQVRKPLMKMCKEVDMPYVAEKWMGGTLTNFFVIKKLIKKYNDITSDKKSGKLEKYTKKERLDFDRYLKKLDIKVGGLTKMNRLPDAMFVWDVKKEKNAIAEARVKNIPIIAICDTNVNPSNINYIIPCNDDATKTIDLVLGLVGEAVKEGKAKVGGNN